MVSIKNAHAEYLLRDIFQSVSIRLGQVDKGSIDYAFAQWIYPTLNQSGAAIFPQTINSTNITDVAHLSYLIENDSSIFDNYKQQLSDGLSRAIGRNHEVFGGAKAPFCSDAIALLGLALGAHRVGGTIVDDIHRWMTNFIDLKSPSLPIWKKIIMFATLDVLEKTSDERISNIGTANSDLILSLSSKGILCFENIEFDDVYHSICNNTISGESEIVLLAARLQAIHYLSNHLPLVALSKPTADQVVKVMENVPSALRRWTWEDKAKSIKSTVQKWDIENEYHVQNLLYVILAALFPDIESEFYLEPVGDQNPRADIGLPSINTIIEVKFMRPTMSFKDLTDQIAADASLYFRGNGVFMNKYTQMIVFVWDNSNRSAHYNTFRKGSNSLDRVYDTVIIGRPNSMSDTKQRVIPKKKSKPAKK